MVSNWKPIDEAVKDGRDYFLGCDLDGDRILGVGYWTENEDYSGWELWHCGSLATWPTHFCEIPK